MKQFFLLITLLCSFNTMFSQAPPTGMYGEYQYIYSIEKNGNKTKNNGAFPRIEPIIVTSCYYNDDSQANYSYITVGGMWQSSNPFFFAGFHNGWYVYTFRLGIQYSYFLISRDYEHVRIQESFQNGVTNVYKRCDPNEKMNNAPTY